MLSIKYVTRFKKDLKKYQHQVSLLQDLNDVLKLLIAKRKLPEKHRDHLLSGNYNEMRECHIKPDLILIYWIDEKNQKLVVERLGSHSDLF